MERAPAERADVIRGKPFLRRIYHDWYRAIVNELPQVTGAVVELGSAGGFLNEYIDGLITTDVIADGHLVLRADARQLPLVDASARAIVMTNVLHHIPDARRFFAESVRCLRPGGRLIMWEPWVTPFSSLIYRHLHHEPFAPQATSWSFPAGEPLVAANGALPWIIFARDHAQFEVEFPLLRIIKTQPAMPFRYLLSGGIAHRALLPARAYSAVVKLERWLAPFASTLGLFALIVVERFSPVRRL